MHSGLPVAWGAVVVAVMAAVLVWGLFAPVTGAPLVDTVKKDYLLSGAAGRLLGKLWFHPWFLIPLKTLVAGLFLLVIWAGLAGTPMAERNFATMLTWNLWWTGVIISVLFAGSAWCAICPWDTLSNIAVRFCLWRKSNSGNSLGIRMPMKLRNVWPALAMFIGLTWLELGVGITTSPYATALLALAIVLLAIIFLAVFERKAFCRYACPVGRTIGFYAQLAPVELRAQKADICATCTTLECYYGNGEVEPCPTHLVMGRLKQNTFCTSCGNCVRSCPHKNVAWRLRPPSSEALEGARPRWDEAWFMIVLLALTGFHGLTMLGFWETGIRRIARLIGDSGQLLPSFSIAMIAAIAVPVALYGLVVLLTRWTTGGGHAIREIFIRLAFIALPLAFAYHLAHNLSHLLRETNGMGGVFANPLGIGTLPLSASERHMRMMDMAVSPQVLAMAQATLMVLGFIVAMLVVRRRGGQLLAKNSATSIQLAPMFGFAVVMTSFHLWMLMQPMMMRM